jgi:hypothetical protein
MSANEFEKNRIEQKDVEQALCARAVFDASVMHIDADTRRRLRDSRGYALRPASQRHRPAWALPIGAAFATALALVVFWPHASPPTSAPIHATDGAAIVAIAPQTHGNPGMTDDTSVDNALADSLPGGGSDGADPELLGNLDFYGWLAKQPVLAHSGG